jgi:anti-sigma B factor antagonist
MPTDAKEAPAMAHTTNPASHGLSRRTALTSPLDDSADLRTSSSYDGIDRITLQVDGEIDLATVDQLGDTLDVAIAKGVRQLIVDLRGVSFLGSDGLHCLAEASQRAEATGCRLYTIATQPVVVRTIDVTRFAPALRLRGDPATVPSPYLDN